jgi:ankyrin repeat protein
MNCAALGNFSWAEAAVRLLLEKGANTEPHDRLGKSTMLHQAAMNGYESVMCLLLDKGANVNAQDTPSGLTLLH